MRLRVFAASIRRIGKPYSRRRFLARRPVIPHIRTQATGPCLPFAGGEHRYRRVICMQLVNREHVLLKPRNQSPQQRVPLSDPAGQGRTFQFDTLAGVNAALPIERPVVCLLYTSRCV